MLTCVMTWSVYLGICTQSLVNVHVVNSFFFSQGWCIKHGATILFQIQALLADKRVMEALNLAKNARKTGLSKDKFLKVKLRQNRKVQ